MMTLGFLLAFAAAILLSLSMKKHYGQLFPDATLSVSHSRVLRALGYLMLAASAWMCVAVKGAGLGLTWFAGLLTVACLLIALLLPLTDRSTR